MNATTTAFPEAFIPATEGLSDAPAAPAGINVPPKRKNAPNRRTRAQGNEKLSSDLVAQFVVSHYDFMKEGKNGQSIDLPTLAVAFTLGTYFNAEKGHAYPSLSRLGEKLAVSASTAHRHLNAATSPWKVNSSGFNRNARYSLPSGWEAELSKWKAGKGDHHYATEISSTLGFTPAAIAPRRESEAPLFVFRAVHAHMLWLVPGAEMHLLAFTGQETHAEKLALAGVTSTRKALTVLGSLSYPSLAAAGFSLLLASRLLNLKTGWASIMATEWENKFGLTARQRGKLNRELEASGLWRVQQDARTKQMVYTLTPLALAQIKAYWSSRLAVDDVTGLRSGTRVATKTVVPGIAGHIRGFFSAAAQVDYDGWALKKAQRQEESSSILTASWHSSHSSMDMDGSPRYVEEL